MCTRNAQQDADSLVLPGGYEAIYKIRDSKPIQLALVSGCYPIWTRGDEVATSTTNFTADS